MIVRPPYKVTPGGQLRPGMGSEEPRRLAGGKPRPLAPGSPGLREQLLDLGVPATPSRRHEPGRAAVLRPPVLKRSGRCS